MTARRLLCWLLAASLVVLLVAPASAVDPTIDPPLPGEGDPPEPGPDVEAATTRLLVRPEATDGSLDRAFSEYDVRVVDEVEELGYLVVEASDADADADELAASLASAPGVDEVVVDRRRSLFVPVRTPNDPYLLDQSTELWNVRAEPAWAITTGSPDVVVAVLDTGVDRNHPDLKGRVLAGRDYIAGGTSPPDPNGHGTAVAGIIAAKGDDGIGIAGMSWKTRILPVRVLDEHGWGWDSDIAAGIVWAADQGAKVINLSLGGPAPSPAYEAAVAHATQKGALVVAAAGNDGTDEPMYPAAVAGVVAVGAANLFGQLTEFSSYGPWIDVTAPGVDVLTTIPRSQGSYAYVSGTSIAAPFVSGTAALVLARWPSRTPSQVRSVLRSTARESGPPGIDAYVGWGMVDAAAAVGGSLADPLFPPAYDGHEPNDVPGRATTLVAGTPTSARISPEGDVDWYRLDLAEPTTATIIVTPPGYSEHHLASSIEPVVAVLDAGLRVIEADVGVAYHPLQLTAHLPAGAMYVAVSNLNGSKLDRAYQIRVNTVGAPPFRGAVPLGGDARIGEALTLGDVTGDGIDDLVVTSRATPHSLRVLAGLPEGGFADAVDHATGALEYRGAGVASLDLDGDGLKDVVVATSSGLQAFHQVGGSLARADGDASPFPASHRPMLVVAGDVSGDGEAELVTTGYDGTWLYRPGEVGWERTHLTDTRYIELAVADLDGSGTGEVVGLASTRHVHVHRAIGEGWTDEATVTSTGVGEEPRAMAIADMDGDGRADVVVTVGSSASTTNVRSLLQQEDGSFAAATPRPIATGPHVAEAADADGDGVVDVVVVHDSGRISLVPGDGAGGFHAPRTTLGPKPIGALHTHSVALVDAEHVGSLGVLTVNSTGTSWFPGGIEQVDGPADVWVRNLTPAPHSRTASRNATIRIDLARDVQPSSITTSTIRLRDGRTGTALPATRSYDVTSRRITVTPEAPLIAGATYRVDVGRLRDVSGEVHEDLVWLPFTIAPDSTAPGPVTGLTANGRVGAVDLTWTAPTAADLAFIEVWKGYGTYPTPEKNGALFHRGTGTKVTIPVHELLTGHLSVYAYDRSGNRSSRATVLVRSSSLSARADATTLTRGGVVTIAGGLVDAGSGKPLNDRKVELLHRPAGQSSWSRAATTTVGKDGAYAFARKPSVTAAYRVRFPGAAGYLGEERNVGTVKVRSAVTAKLSATSVKKGAAVRLTGTVAPVRSGAQVDVEVRRADGSWRRVGTTKVRSDGSYTFSLATTSTGTHSYRVRMPATDTNLAGTSPTVKLKVT